jgi:alkylresorcinol/alkylpyrone synthase
VRPIDWYLTPLGWPERATVYLEGACELFVDAAKQQGARSYERASCSRSCCLSSGFTAALTPRHEQMSASHGVRSSLLRMRHFP